MLLYAEKITYTKVLFGVRKKLSLTYMYDACLGKFMINYYNALYIGLPLEMVQKLELVQNLAV